MPAAAIVVAGVVLESPVAGQGHYYFFRASNQDAAEAAISDLPGLGIEDRTEILSAGISQIEFIR